MPHTIYENFVLQDKIESTLDTLLDMNQFITPDNSLVANPGMKVEVTVKTGSGDAEELDKGEGNSSEITVTTKKTEYKVKTTQAKFAWDDEDEMTDPKLVDAGTQYLAESMNNSLTRKSVAEFEKATLKQEYTKANGITFADVVRAISKLKLEQNEQLFALVNHDTSAELTINLADQLKYVEAFVRTGYVGTIAGVNIYTTKGIKTEGEMIIASRAAVTSFMKKGVEVAQKRDPDKRHNEMFSRKVTLVALTDERKVVLIKPQDP